MWVSSRWHGSRTGSQLSLRTIYESRHDEAGRIVKKSKDQRYLIEIKNPCARDVAFGSSAEMTLPDWNGG